MYLTIEDELLSAVEVWMNDLIDTISSTATEAYLAGTYSAMGQLGIGLSWKVAQKDALEFVTKYRKRLVEDGVIEVSEPVVDDRGRIIGHKTTEKKWLADKPVGIRNDLVEIISRGLAEGRATGVRIDEDGKYPIGSIAEEIQEYLEGYKSQASTVARTETARCYYGGMKERYARNGVEYVQFLGAPDACEFCEPMIGQIFALGTEPQIPLHPNCRCNYRPYFPKEGEIINTSSSNQ